MLELSAAHTPLCTEALNCVVAERLEKLRVLVVLMILFHEPPLSIEDSQLRIVPVIPVRESVPALAVAQTVALAESEPGTV